MHRLHTNHNILCAEHFHILDQGKSDHTAKENIKRIEGTKLAFFKKNHLSNSKKRKHQLTERPILYSEEVLNLKTQLKAYGRLNMRYLQDHLNKQIKLTKRKNRVFLT